MTSKSIGSCDSSSSAPSESSSPAVSLLKPHSNGILRGFWPQNRGTDWGMVGTVGRQAWREGAVRVALIFCLCVCVLPCSRCGAGRAAGQVQEGAETLLGQQGALQSYTPNWEASEGRQKGRKRGWRRCPQLPGAHLDMTTPCFEPQEFWSINICRTNVIQQLKAYCFL